MYSISDDRQVLKDPSIDVIRTGLTHRRSSRIATGRSQLLSMGVWVSLRCQFTFLQHDGEVDDGKLMAA